MEKAKPSEVKVGMNSQGPYAEVRWQKEKEARPTRPAGINIEGGKVDGLTLEDNTFEGVDMIRVGEKGELKNATAKRNKIIK
jgi:hypothetical protein